MPIIVRFKDPSNLTDKEVYYPNTGDNFGEFLANNFTRDFGGLETDIFLNGDPFASTLDGDTVNDKINYIIKSDDKFVIINRPAAAAIPYIIYAVIAIAAAILLAPDIPGTADAAGTSPNSQLNAATNEFRPGQAIPEIFGSPISYPDFIQPSHYFYENNLKIQRELFCIGIGSFDVTAVRTGETLIDDIPSSLYTLYDTAIDGIPPQSQRVTARETNEVTNQTLPAINDSSIEGIFGSTSPDVLVSGGGNTDVLVGNEIITNLSLSIGDTVNVKVTETVGAGSESTVLIGVWQIVDITFDYITLPTGINIATTPGASSVVTVSRATSSGDSDNFIGWFGVSGDQVSEVWFHFSMPTGIRGDGGGDLSVTLRGEIRQVDEFGVPIVGGHTATDSVTITGNTLDAQFRTLKFTGLPIGRYQGRARNSSDLSGGSASEKATFEQMVGVEYQGTPNYGDVTLLWVERKASDRIVGGSQSKINVDLTRKLPSYNRTTGNLQLINVATRDFADAVAYTLIRKANRPDATVDLEDLYAINDALPANLRSFDFTFDDANVGLRERLTVICSVARTLAYQNYQFWSFNRVEAKVSHSMLFNRRNTIGESTQTFPQWLPSNKDSISLTYVTLPDNVEKTIYRRLQGNVIVDTDEGSYPEEITLVGCQSEAQANDRADYEIRRLLYQRNTVEFQTYYFGLTARIGDRVRWCDMNDQDVFGGEILDVFGDEYLTSEPITFEAGKTYYAQTTKQDGTIGGLVTCSALSYTTKGFKSTALSGAYTANDGDFELGSKYVIAPDDELIGTDYTLKSVSSSGDGLVTISLTEYNDK
ncbi:MAG TPA: hypothetical protein DDW91_02920, partial [Shewanella frigidimarina]|nr:hypothetical protein [Shewanella frigidimarina]